MHEGGFRMVVRDGGFRFYKPDGTLLPNVPASPVVAADIMHALNLAHAEHLIEPWTASSRWNGEPLDLDFTVRALCGLTPAGP